MVKKAAAYKEQSTKSSEGLFGYDDDDDGDDGDDAGISLLSTPP